MKFTFTCKKVNLNDSIKAYAEKKIGKLDRYFQDEADAAVTFLVEKDHRCVVEITIRSKYKTRLSKRLRQDAFVPDIPAEFDVSEEKEFEVVRTKHIAVKPMSIEEAIMQMNLLDHDFFVFRNMEDVICIVYQRKSGGYGLIETNGDLV